MKSPFHLDRMNLHLHRFWYSHPGLRWVVFISSLVIYAASFLALAPRLGVSVNYLVLIPVITGSFTLGIFGGVATGTLGLASNILLLYLLGLVRYSPENWPVAQASGVLLGMVLGFLGEHYRFMGQEIFRRIEAEKKLQQALKERSMLLREVQHRVKNNLNVVHSLIGLQRANLGDHSDSDSLENLSRRIGSMAMVHDQFGESSNAGELALSAYLRALIVRIVDTYVPGHISVRYDLDDADCVLSLSRATPLGLIVNEVISNAIQHAFQNNPEPSIEVSTRCEGRDVILMIRDNGPGFDAGAVKSGLGLQLIKTLSRQLGAEYEFDEGSGTAFSIRIPVEDSGGEEIWPLSPEP